MLVVAVVIAGVISFFGELVFRLFFQSGVSWRGSRSSGSGEKKGGAGIAILIALGLVALCWILSIVVRFALSRQREYLADAGSVELTKNPDAMIMALRKIEGRGELAGANSAVMEMCIDNPREGFSNLFDTHPSVDKRVAALVQFAGGHDPGPLALPAPDDTTPPDENAPNDDVPPGGPWGADPNRTSEPDAGQKGGQIPGPWSGPLSGPWGPTRSN
jgi:heat shock protein HtpX